MRWPVLVDHYNPHLSHVSLLNISRQISKASGIISFGITGGKAAGAHFIDALQMILRLVNIGDAKSLACHPATTTHRQLNAQELARAGVNEDLVRISVGIEHIDDIIADVSQALEASQRGA